MTSLDQAMRKAFERHDKPAAGTMATAVSETAISGVKAISDARMASVSRPASGGGTRELFVDAPEKRLRGAHRPPDRRSSEPHNLAPVGQPPQSQSAIPRLATRESNQPVGKPSRLPEPALRSTAKVDMTESFGAAINSLLSYELSVAGPGVDAWPINDVVPPIMSAGDDLVRQREEPASQTIDLPRQPFKAAWETDAFRTSPICRKIQAHLQVPLHLAVAELMETVSAKRPVVPVFAGRPGAGATTVSIVLALSLAKAGWRVMLIDGDVATETPLAEHLGIAIDGGWNSMTAAGLDASECCVHALADGFCVLPMERGEHVDGAATLSDLAPLLQRLMGSFDVVLVDCGRPHRELDCVAFEQLGARIIVNDLRVDVESSAVEPVDARLAQRQGGTHVIDNFALLHTS